MIGDSEIEYKGGRKNENKRYPYSYNGNLMILLLRREKSEKTKSQFISGDSGKSAQIRYLFLRPLKPSSRRHCRDYPSQHLIWSLQLPRNSLWVPCQAVPLTSLNNPGKTYLRLIQLFKSYKTFYYFNISAPEYLSIHTYAFWYQFTFGWR